MARPSSSVVLVGTAALVAALVVAALSLTGGAAAATDAPDGGVRGVTVDATGTAGSWSGYKKFYVDWTAGAAPVISCPGPYTDGSWTDTPPATNVTCRATGAAPSTWDQNVRLEVQVDGCTSGPPVVVAQAERWALLHPVTGHDGSPVVRVASHADWHIAGVAGLRGPLAAWQAALRADPGRRLVDDRVPVGPATLRLHVEGDTIADVSYEGMGCSISQASI